MNEVGVMFEKNEAFIPDMLIASRAMKQGMEQLKPHLKGGRSDTLGKIIVGTVKGDLHDIGKNLVSIFYESVGFEVIDLGTDVTTEKFIEAINKNNAKIVSLSALLTTTMINQAETLKTIKAKYGEEVAVLVGGAPVTKEWADSVGADGYSPNAYGACKIASSISR
jgi:5-methyltetrahydrofolate--homocysteine methyltransferase